VTTSTTYARYLRRQGVRANTTPHRAAHHIALLRAAGMRDPQIAAAAGRSPATLYRIAKRHTVTISRHTETQILAIPIPAPAGQGSASHTPSHGTARRLQALVHHGYPPAWIARHLGMTRKHLGDLLHQRRAAVTLHTAQRVEALYLTHWHLPAERAGVDAADTARARTIATAHHWQPAAAWDDIDHPGAQPQHGGDTSRQQAVIEDAAELLREGLSREGVAARLGIGWDAVRQAYRRAGRELPDVCA
jgi:AraC-like DNA-binding protein